MSIEELLKPRYKVIADYPSSDYKVGNIIENIGVNYCEFLNRYPHLFRKLEWYEERAIEDMPQYVKSLLNQEYYKVVQRNEISFSAVQEWPGGWGIDYPWSNTLPATPEEYNTYKNK